MGKTALIVDDSKSARVVLKRMLETHELDVDTAESAEGALEYLNGNMVDEQFIGHVAWHLSVRAAAAMDAVTTIESPRFQQAVS